VRAKLTSEPEPETLSISVKRNLLRVQSEGTKYPYGGEIVMNEQFIQSGRGQYTQAYDDDTLWGFWDVQLKDADTILVHTTYVDARRNAEVVPAALWERIGTS
jgi:hypothetical protein